MGRAYPLLLAAAPLLALLAGLLLAFAPVYSSGDSLLQREGSWVLLLLAGLVAVSSLPLRARAEVQPGLAAAVGVGLVIFSFISVIGVWFLPAAAMLLIASLARGTTGT